MSDARQPPHYTWNSWSDWSMISAHTFPGFTLWVTGLPGTGKRTLARSIRHVLIARGYKAEIVDALHLLRRPAPESNTHIQHAQPAPICQLPERVPDDDALTIFLCGLLVRNGIIAITTSLQLEPHTRKHAHEQLPALIQVHLSCLYPQRQERLLRQETAISESCGASQQAAQSFQSSPVSQALAELHIDTTSEILERSALRIITYLEHNGYIAPLWETPDDEDEEVCAIKARLQSLGYLE